MILSWANAAWHCRAVTQASSDRLSMRLYDLNLTRDLKEITTHMIGWGAPGSQVAAAAMIRVARRAGRDASPGGLPGQSESGWQSPRLGPGSGQTGRLHRRASPGAGVRTRKLT